MDKIPVHNDDPIIRQMLDEYYNGPKMVDDIKKSLAWVEKMKFVASCGFESCGLDGEPYNLDTITIEAETTKDAEEQLKKYLQEQNKKGENTLVYDLDNIVIETLDEWFESYLLQKNFDSGRD